MNSMDQNATECRRRWAFPFSSWVNNVIFWGIAAIVCVSVLYDVDLIFGGEHTFLDNICQGVMRPFSLGRSIGRFTPFTHWDCNFVLIFKFLPKECYITVCYALNALLLLISLLICSRLIEFAISDLRGWIANIMVLLSLVAIVLTPDFMRVFWHNAFPESRLIFLFLLFTIAFRRTVENDSWKSAIVAFVSIAIAIGYKETWLVVCLGFVGTYVFFAFRAQCRHRRFLLVFGSGVLRRYGRTLVVSLIFLIISYIVFYKFWWVLGMKKSYMEGRSGSIMRCLGFYLKNPILIVAAMIACFRLCMMLFRRQRRHLFWDAMLFSGVFFALSYAAVGLGSDYYAAPAYVLIIPALVYWLGRISHKSKSIAVGIMICTGVWIWHASPRIIRQWNDFHTQRVSDMPFIRELANDKNIRNVYYLLPSQQGRFDWYPAYIFDKFFRYAGGDAIEKIDEIKEISDEEAIVVYLKDRKNVGLAKKLERMASKTSKSLWYKVYYGPISFRVGDDRTAEIGHSDEIFMKGFYTDGKSGRWGESNNASIEFTVSPQLAGKPVRVIVKAGALTVRKAKMPKNRLRILINDVEVFYKKVNSLEDIEFGLPAGFLASGSVTVKFLVDHIICPNELDIGKDKRKFGVWFQSLKITAIDKVTETVR